MTIQTALEQIKSRSPKFSTLKSALVQQGLPKSNNMINLETKFSNQTLPAAQLIVQAQRLERIYKDNVDWGDKAVQFTLKDVFRSLAQSQVNSVWQPVAVIIRILPINFDLRTNKDVHLILI